MNGLLLPTQGEVRLNNQALSATAWNEQRRQIGYCLQGSTLFPHLNVSENLSIVAKRVGWSKEKIFLRVTEVLELVQLEPKEFLDRKPSQLSGGQKQRVSLARALFMKPQILLMDEPFGALDEMTRREIQTAFLQLQLQLGLTVVLVTHDLREAERLSQDLILLQNGRIAQRGPAEQMRSQPSSQYVRDFFNRWAMA